MNRWLLKLCFASVLLFVVGVHCAPKRRLGTHKVSVVSVFQVGATFIHNLDCRNVYDYDYDCAGFNASEKELWALLKDLLASDPDQAVGDFSFRQGVAHRQNTVRSGAFYEVVEAKAQKILNISRDYLTFSKEKNRAAIYPLLAFVQGFLNGGDLVWRRICDTEHYSLVEDAFCAGVAGELRLYADEDVLSVVFKCGQNCRLEKSADVKSCAAASVDPGVYSLVSAVRQVPRFVNMCGSGAVPDSSGLASHRQPQLLSDVFVLRDTQDLMPTCWHDSSLKEKLFAEVEARVPLSLSGYPLWIKGFCLGYQTGDVVDPKPFEELHSQLVKRWDDLELLEFCDGVLEGCRNLNRSYELPFLGELPDTSLFSFAADRAVPPQSRVLEMLAETNIKVADAHLQLVSLMKIAGCGVKEMRYLDVPYKVDSATYWDQKFRICSAFDDKPRGKIASMVRAEHDRIKAMGDLDAETETILAKVLAFTDGINVSTKTAQRLTAERDRRIEKRKALLAQAQQQDSEAERIASEKAAAVAAELEAEEAFERQREVDEENARKGKRARFKLAKKQRTLAANITSSLPAASAPHPSVAAACSVVSINGSPAPDEMRVSFAPDTSLDCEGAPFLIVGKKKGATSIQLGRSGARKMHNKGAGKQVLETRVSAQPAPLAEAPRRIIVRPSRAQNDPARYMTASSASAGAGGVGADVLEDDAVGVLLQSFGELSVASETVSIGCFHSAAGVLPAALIPALVSVDEAVLPESGVSSVAPLLASADFRGSESADVGLAGKGVCINSESADVGLAGKGVCINLAWDQQRNLGRSHGNIFAVSCVRDNLCAFDMLVRSVDDEVVRLAHDSSTNHSYLAGLRDAYIHLALELCTAFNVGVALGFAERVKSNISFFQHEHERRLFLQGVHPDYPSLLNYYHAVGCCFGFQSSTPFTAHTIGEIHEFLQRGPNASIVVRGSGCVALPQGPISPQLVWITPPVGMYPLTSQAAFRLGVEQGTMQFVDRRQAAPDALAQMQAFANMQMALLAAANPCDSRISYWYGFKSGGKEANKEMLYAMRRGLRRGCRFAGEEELDFGLLTQNLTRSIAMTRCLPVSKYQLNRMLYLTALQGAFEAEVLRRTQSSGYGRVAAELD